MNIHAIRRWHGLVGVGAVVFLLYLLLSGLIINHGDALKLDQKEVSSPWLMHWYGMHVANPTQGYRMGGSYFVWDENRWVLGDRLLSGNSGQPVGAIEIGGRNYVATATALYAYQPDGRLINKIEGRSLPANPILALGRLGNNIAMQTPSAVFVSANGQVWIRAATPTGTILASLQELPAEVEHRSADILAPSISLQRIFLDIHSGRIFGRYAFLLVDLVSLVLLILGVSGFWLYWKLR